jgi:hypothetical protein
MFLMYTKMVAESLRGSTLGLEFFLSKMFAPMLNMTNGGGQIPSQKGEL